MEVGRSCENGFRHSPLRGGKEEEYTKGGQINILKVLRGLLLLIMPPQQSALLY